jgi:hypothetical protein
MILPIAMLIGLISMAFLKIIGHVTTGLESVLLGVFSYFLSNYIVSR